LIFILSKFNSIWFWQRSLSPHIAYVASEIKILGVEVIYVVNELISSDRKKIGWKRPAKLLFSKLVIEKVVNSLTRLIKSASVDSVHICQGLRGNNLIGVVQKELAKKKIKQWLVLEKVEEKFFSKITKRIIYRWLLYYSRNNIEGILAIGHKSKNWYIARGVKSDKIYPFAYFLSDSILKTKKSRKNYSVFRFIFVGQLIERKRVDFLIRGLSTLIDKIDFELEIIGEGPLRSELQLLANTLIPGRVNWLKKIPLEEVPQRIANADCLVLPSRHDGWGAVVSEALMVGTPVICSDECGSSEIVTASGTGSVFQKDNFKEFSSILLKTVKNGFFKNSKRFNLKKWAKCLGAKAGAKYLIKILLFSRGYGNRPLPPWIKFN
jgi:glycosyltransferase involved in cell wall biosynthesis